MPDIINRQRKVNIETRPLEAFAARARAAVPETEGRDVTVAFVSDKRMKALNGEFRGKDSTTDVLSFPYEPEEFETENDFLGDIIISAEQAERQASENGLDLATEFRQLILHGILHLCGYDHETDDGEMNARELELREALGI